MSTYLKTCSKDEADLVIMDAESDRLITAGTIPALPGAEQIWISRIPPRAKSNAEIAKEILLPGNSYRADMTNILDAVDAKIAAAVEPVKKLAECALEELGRHKARLEKLEGGK